VFLAVAAKVVQKPHRKSALDADSRNSSWVPYAFFEYIGKQINAGFD
jgi:hypothetical protein